MHKAYTPPAYASKPKDSGLCVYVWVYIHTSIYNRYIHICLWYICMYVWYAGMYNNLIIVVICNVVLCVCA